MISQRYVWLIWSLSLLAVWGVIYLGAPRLRRVMMWSSLLALPFGFSEALFVHVYWNPVSLWGLAGRIHFDIESFIYCFAIGGTAAVLFDLLTCRAPFIPAKPARRARHPQWHNAALASAALVFPVVLVTTNRPLIAGSVAMIVGAICRVVVLPELASKTLVGGLFFAIYYIAAISFLRWLSPGYLREVWTSAALGWGWILGVPRIELAFGLSFGWMWSGLYEQARWTMMPAGDSITPAAARLPPPASGDIRRHPPAPSMTRR